MGILDKLFGKGEKKENERVKIKEINVVKIVN